MSKRIVGRWVLEIDGHTARLNELMYARVKTRIGLRYRDDMIILAACRRAGVAEAQGKRRIDLHVTLGPRQREGDEDDPFHKSLLDALKACKAIVNDTRKWCEATPTTYSRGPKAGMVVTLTDLEAKEV
jgi:hypothetical protein